MKKTLIGGSLLVVLVLLMLPAVTAEEVKIAQSNTKTQNLLSVETTYLETIRNKYKDDPSPQIIFITLGILLLKLLRWGLIIIGGIFILAILRIISKPHNNTSAIL